MVETHRSDPHTKHITEFSFSCEIVHDKPQEQAHRNTCLDINNHYFRIKFLEMRTCIYMYCTIKTSSSSMK